MNCYTTLYRCLMLTGQSEYSWVISLLILFLWFHLSFIVAFIQHSRSWMWKITSKPFDLLQWVNLSSVDRTPRMSIRSTTTIFPVLDHRMLWSRKKSYCKTSEHSRKAHICSSQMSWTKINQNNLRNSSWINPRKAILTSDWVHCFQG